MSIDTPEGKLDIGDSELVFAPADDGPVITVSLSPMPHYEYQASLYGTGHLVIGEAVIELYSEQATAVVTELARTRSAPAGKTAKAHAAGSDH